MIGGSTLIPAAAAAVSSIAGHALELLTRGPGFAELLADSSSVVDPSSTGSPAEFHGPADTSTGEAARLNAARQNIARLEEQLRDRLVTRLQGEPGIDLSEPIVLGVHVNGRVLELTGHRDRASIEQLFENDPQLADQVRQLLRQASQVQPDASNRRSFLPAQLVIDQPQSVFAVV